MENLFMLLFLLCFIALIVGLINPKLTIKWGNNKQRNRKKVLLSYGVGAVVLFVLAGITADNTTSQVANSQNVQHKVEVQQNQQAQTPVNTEEKVKKEEDVKLPEYKIELVDNSNIGQNIIRETLHIVVKEKCSLDQLYKIAEKEAISYTQDHKVNALAIGFYKDKSHIGKGYDMGHVNYVPNGKWGDAMNVESGDYSTFQFENCLSEPLELK
ncbi:CHASE3 domain-containing protein [Clostridium botulinum]|uniref:CHASE3 domain-containing protein n=1 Tax=Clostridium botulinum TaxID=1491 RepID=UPI0004D97007|nr:hypothetical protein [Clostridium botulinum]KEH99685.1 hypothetical protein Z952_p0004 [Clostridium botulinum C/D str. BKT75002]KEI05163.1 hypothetical protein Z954_0004 [Clostridium botulinum C/D str. BKT2873]QPW62059.1 hypothetical protein IG390_13425 [Clostridium botulinum]